MIKDSKEYSSPLFSRMVFIPFPTRLEWTLTVGDGNREELFVFYYKLITKGMLLISLNYT